MTANVRRLVFSRDRQEPPVPREERWMLMFSINLCAAALFVAGLAPLLLVGAVAFACAFGEACSAVDRLLLLRNPVAEVRELPGFGQ